MIKVGITQRQSPPTQTGEIRNGLDERWAQFLWDLEILAIPLPNVPQMALSVINELDLDGVILSGGDDLSEYGGESPERDETDRLLLRWALESGRPLLGVCRGMELIAVSMGCQLEEVDGHVGVTNHFEGPLMVGDVTCYHRWAVVDLSTDLVCLGRVDSVIEALSTPNGRILGVMWHPEREWPENPVAAQLVKAHFGGPS